MTEMSHDTEVCGNGFPHDACIKEPGHEPPHERIPVITTKETQAFGLDKVTYGDVVAGTVEYVIPEEFE